MSYTDLLGTQWHCHRALITHAHTQRCTSCTNDLVTRLTRTQLSPARAVVERVLRQVEYLGYIKHPKLWVGAQPASSVRRRRDVSSSWYSLTGAHNNIYYAGPQSGHKATKRLQIGHKKATKKKRAPEKTIWLPLSFKQASNSCNIQFYSQQPLTSSHFAPQYDIVYNVIHTMPRVHSWSRHSF